MPVMIQIRHVPDEVHRQIKARAASAGMSMSDYLLRLITRSVGRLTLEEFGALLDTREPVELKESVVDILREQREERSKELEKRVRPRRLRGR
jgi:plasmid stability protein